MTRLMPNHAGQMINFSPIPLAIALFFSVSLLVALCAKHARKYSTKATTSDDQDRPNKQHLRSAKQLITAVGHKAMAPLVCGKKSGLEFNTKMLGIGREENGLWQKAILMGEKCQPPEFSGVIYYDYDGNRIAEMPKSPRAGAVSPLKEFTFPVEKMDKSMY
ncbi:hypothetical protein STAS_27757 [Striga asiatica]|uniref:Transmembrane protein n=1 Tax=Striga asiatica TaxID=4170 RepID=A0A5A7QZA6_STRAF|nr:hypothetical protein STAS_27757 [Striga asiatica]